MPAVPTTPAALARTITEQLVGRRLTTTVEGHEVGLTLTELDYPADSLRLATGRLGDVRIVAEDVDWPAPATSAAPAEQAVGHPDEPRTGGAATTSSARDEKSDPTTAAASGAVAGNQWQADTPQQTDPGEAGKTPGTKRRTPDLTEQPNPADGRAIGHPGERGETTPPGDSTAEHDLQATAPEANAVPRPASTSPATSAEPHEPAQPTSRRVARFHGNDREPVRTTGPTIGTDAHPVVDRIPLRRVTVLAKDVRLRGLPSPAVIPASVWLEIEVNGEVLRDRVAAARPDLIATPHADGFHVRWRKHPHWGHLTLVAGIDGTEVVLTPAKLHIGRWTMRAPKRVRPIVLPLPDLPKGLRLNGIRPDENELRLTIAADEWPGRLARIPLPDILNWLTTAAMTLTLPGFGTRSLP